MSFQNNPNLASAFLIENLIRLINWRLEMLKDNARRASLNLYHPYVLLAMFRLYFPSEIPCMWGAHIG